MARILLVDDDPVILEMTQDILNKYADKKWNSEWKLQIHTAPDAIKALSLLEEFNYELIITDILMARMDGWEFIRKVREKYSQLDLPIIVLSAIDAVELEYKSMRYGASAWIQKPIRPKTFTNQVFNLISER